MPENKIQQGAPNPLASRFRQPKIYLRLPSGGQYYPEGSINITENGEYPVYSMTAKDELVFKTPDALLNGEATVQVIQSCIPAITNAWHVPSIDLDAILVAIRIATYGEKISISATVPNTDINKDFDLDLTQLLTKLTSSKWSESFMLNDLVVKMKPLNYKTFTQQMIKQFEEQRVFNLVANEELSDEDKLSRFNKSFDVINDINIGTICACIESIAIGDELVNNPIHIREFVENADTASFNEIKSHVENMKTLFNIEPISVDATEEEIKKGAPSKYKVPIIFDQSNFFGSGS